MTSFPRVVLIVLISTESLDYEEKKEKRNANVAPWFDTIF